MHADKLKSLEFMQHGVGHEASGKQKRQIFANDNDQWSNSALSIKKQSFQRSSAMTPVHQIRDKSSHIAIRKNRLPPLDDDEEGDQDYKGKQSRNAQHAKTTLGRAKQVVVSHAYDSSLAMLNKQQDILNQMPEEMDYQDLTSALQNVIQIKRGSVQYNPARDSSYLVKRQQEVINESISEI